MTVIRSYPKSRYAMQANQVVARWWPVLLAVILPTAFIAGVMYSGGDSAAPEPTPLLNEHSRRKLMAEKSGLKLGQSAAQHATSDGDRTQRREISDLTQDPGMAGIMDRRGFKFARSVTEYILELSYARSAENTSEPLYSKDELHMVLRSLNTMRGFMNQGLWSGSHASMHFLGTGSCLIKLKQPAIQVAIGSMHGVYLQKWRKHAYKGFYEKECDKRYRLRTVLGSELEGALWVDTAMFGNGPYSTCTKVYNQMYERNMTKYDKVMSDFIEEAPLHMLYCDEIEEAMGGEAILSGHWKRRDHEFFDDTFKLVNYMGEPRLGKWTRDAEEMSLHMMHPNQAYIHFKELTPPDAERLFNTAKLNPEADSMDIERWSEMIDVTRHEQALVTPYNKPTLLPRCRKGIHQTREMCDKVVSGEYTLDKFVEIFESLKKDVLMCERTDPRFQVEIPLPHKIPRWADPSNHPNFKVQ
mmetsp:Transcript_20141/g.43436  ORF Transcript_20141/g.43436 Transcript_20141/m.43436 type:complete len:470 (+) Transcript_20141:169-1578(+)|eukprot:CAMPEP_0168747004 /NCGR_PEP_ID=MMETSP0724-20121128/15440_1 /TAXON_ID=265536 /ORGANISM="Amphiprora sp., Strain CCMP467" /LENGTH=469 /DNA_ID=CAMNT_0008794795 /DNA_START=138 /DNA_END=1547 /DNA_ORIENTATION=+